MNSYSRDLEVERRGKERLMPFLRGYGHGEVLVIKGSGPLARIMQREWAGDYLIGGQNTVSVEVKVDTNYTNRICFEQWSNLVFRDFKTYLERGHTAGWGVTLRAMVLLYYWIDADRLAVIDLFALQKWALQPIQGGVPNIERHQLNGRGELVPQFPCFQPRINQLNDTWMRWIPIPVLHRELTPPPLIVSVQQLMLDLKDQPDPFAAAGETNGR